MAQAPKCKVCGEAHWGMAHPGMTKEQARATVTRNVTRNAKKERVTPPVTPNVTEPVTRNVTPVTDRVVLAGGAHPDIAFAERLDRLEEKLNRILKALEGLGPSQDVPPPVEIGARVERIKKSNAARQAAYRARKKGDA